MAFNYPILPDSTAQREFQETFGGYNHNLRIADNEFYDMKNMTGDYYPVLSPRCKRGTIQNINNPQAIICKDALCYIANGQLYINGEHFENFNGDGAALYQMVGMGAYLLVFEKTANGLENGWYINTVNYSEYGNIDNVVSFEPSSNPNNRLSFAICGKDGEVYNNVHIGLSPPSNPQNGAKWIDTSGSTHYMKIYAGTTKMWTAVLTTYVKLSYPGIALGFKEGDAVDISGLSIENNNAGNYDGKLVEQVDFLNANAVIQSLDSDGGNWMVIIGMIDQVCEQKNGSVVIARQAPYMDYICECNNRLWGCRYGLNRAGETVNAIYACKQGNFKNWRCFPGIATDSYEASVGSDGVWTGAVHYGKEVIFFKENCMHKLYGSMPSDYQLLELKHRGLQRGSEKSLVCVNETLFYKTTTEICYYDGSLPVSISYPLGERSFFNAAAGSIGNKYYISMQNEQGAWELFVYDIGKQRWYKEDDLHVAEFCRVDNSLYAVVPTGGGSKIVDLAGTGLQEGDFAWYAETGEIGYSYSDNKYVGRILIRLSKLLTSEVRLLIRYDNAEQWEVVAELSGGGTRTFNIPVLPRRCDHFRFRIEGKGECKIYSISKVLDIGSDVF